MKYRYSTNEWCQRYKQCKTASERLQLLGPPIVLAGEILGIRRTRVHQLIQEGKLDSVSVYDGDDRRVGHFITQTSLDRRRKIRYKRGQWRPGDGRVVRS